MDGDASSDAIGHSPVAWADVHGEPLRLGGGVLRAPVGAGVGYGQRPETWLDYLQRTKFPIIDELGVEMQMNDYGEKCEGFNLVINAAERYNRPMFITTNLTEEQILARYGERTLDRLGHLCKMVKFSGESLRK
ncbi:MAG: hypothetical protein IJ840_06475 [Bacteroidales bacterium]|nr:hypothetical protein [Bacteroidales bacterium]